MILIPSKYLRKIRLNSDSYIIYHSLFGNPLRVTPTVLDIIKKFSAGVDIKRVSREKGEFRKYKELILGLKRNNFLTEKDAQEYDLFKKSSIDKIRNNVLSGKYMCSLRFEMASYCNFRCKHCFAEKVYDWKQNILMDFTTARLAVDGFIRILKKHNIKSARMTYWGGEPLLNWNTIARTVEYTKRVTKGLPIEISQGIITNASLFNDSILDFIRRFKMGVRISLDGLEQSNDRFRIFSNGRGTFKSIIRGLDGLSKYRIPFTAELMLTSYNFYSLEKVLDFLQDKYNCRSFVVSPIFYQKRSHEFDRHSIKEKAKRFIELYDYAVKKGFSFGMPALEAARVAIQQRWNPAIACQGLYGALYVKPSGSLCTCGQLSTEIGNVRRMEEIFLNENYRQIASRSVDRIPGCHGCDIEGLCAGGCAGAIKFYSGDIYNTSHSLVQKNYCELMRLCFKEILKRHTQ